MENDLMSDEVKVPAMVVGIGEVVWDMLPEGKKIGGAPANFAYHVGQFGLQSMVVSAIGDDDAGDGIADTFDGMGMNYELARVPHSTGCVRVRLDASGVPVYDICEHVAWDYIPFTPALAAVASRCRAVCFGSLAQRGEVSRATIYRFLDLMPDNDDTLKVFDINLRQSFYDREIVEESMRRCNVLKINDEELEIVSKMLGCQTADPEKNCPQLMEDYNLKMLILTCGVNGSYLFTRDDISFVPTPRVEVADTVGAGDSFTAAFIASILRGDSVAEAHRRAAEVSAYICTQAGAMPVLPSKYTE